jgi:hypothetical protein
LAVPVAALVLGAPWAAGAPAAAPKPGERPNPYVAPLIPQLVAPATWGGAIAERFRDPAWQTVTPVLADWDIRGTHAVDKGILRLGDPNFNRENVSLMAKKPYINFTLEVQARVLSDPKGWGVFGLWFRAAEPRGLFYNDDLAIGGTSGYGLNLSTGQKSLVLLRRPHGFELAPRVPAVTDRNWHTFRVEAAGNQYTCSVDGKLIFRTADNNPKGPFWWGYVGIGVTSRGVAEVRSITITPR